MLARIEGATTPARLIWSWSNGTGVARRGRPGRLLLAVRHWPSENAVRPLAVVAVEPAPDGTRVTGVIRPLRPVQVWYATVIVVSLLLAAVGVVVLLVAGNPAPLVAGVFFAALTIGLPWFFQDDRAVLRALLEDAVR